MSRIYIVTDAADNSQHLVEAESQAQAVNAVVAERYKAQAATAIEVADLMSNGVKLVRTKKVTGPVEDSIAAAAAEAATT